MLTVMQALLSTAAMIALTAGAHADQQKMSDADYIAKIMTAAPEAVTKGPPFSPWRTMARCAPCRRGSTNGPA
jgi:hypothetical protein